MSKRDSNSEPKGPDFRRIDPDLLKEAKFPAKLIGEFRVHLTEDADDRIMTHAGTTDQVELCGVLVGDVCRDELGPYLEISAIIEGKAANNYGAQVTFTHETWAHINSVMDKEHAGKRIVGWYHTHPGFGVFLSDMDMFIQENFFNQPYQVALVVETRRKEIGCFAWRNGKCVPLRRMWVGNHEVSLIEGEAKPFDPKKKPIEPAAPQAPRDDADRPKWGITSGAVMMALAGCLIGWTLGRFISAGETQQMVRDTAQTEVYSILEYAALSDMMVQDAQTIRDRLQKAQALLPESETDSPELLAELKTAEALAAQMASAYGKQRNQFRSDLAAVSAKRRSLSQNVRRLEQQMLTIADALDAYTSEIGLLNIKVILAKTPSGNPVDLPPQDQAVLREYVNRIVQQRADMKGVMQKIFPGLIEFCYPTPMPTPAADTHAATTTAPKPPTPPEREDR